MTPIVHRLDFGGIEKDAQWLGGKPPVIFQDMIAQRRHPAPLSRGGDRMVIPARVAQEYLEDRVLSGHGAGKDWSTARRQT